MEREYLQTFNQEQLEHYLQTLKRRVRDLKELTTQLGEENKELGYSYQQLIIQKESVYRSNEKKKKSWSNWFNKGKQKIGSLLTRNKQEEYNPQIEPVNQSEPKEVEQVDQQGQYEQIVPQKKRLNIFQVGREKIVKLLGSGKKQEKEEGTPIVQQYLREPKVQLQSELVEQEDSRGENRYFQYLKRTQEKDIKLQNTQTEGEKEPVLLGKQKQQSTVENISQCKNISVANQQNKKISKPIAVSVSQAVKISPQLVKEEKQEKEVGLIEQKEKVMDKPEEQKKKEEVQTLPEGEEDNQYAVQYEAPIKDFELQEGAVLQIVQKPNSSQEDIQSPIHAPSVPLSQNLQAKPQSSEPQKSV